jgi:hypothetical protein
VRSNQWMEGAVYVLWCGLSPWVFVRCCLSCFVIRVYWWLVCLRRVLALALSGGGHVEEEFKKEDVGKLQDLAPPYSMRVMSSIGRPQDWRKLSAATTDGMTETTA